MQTDVPIKERPTADLRDYLAEERTFLAWIRTGIALMGFGFLVAHFGISGDEPHALQQASGTPPQQLSLWLGLGLIAAGVTINLLSALRYMRMARALKRGQFVQRSLSKQGLIVALFLALLGLGMTVWMIPVVASQPNVARGHNPTSTTGTTAST